MRENHDEIRGPLAVKTFKPFFILDRNTQIWFNGFVNDAHPSELGRDFDRGVYSIVGLHPSVDSWVKLNLHLRWNRLE